MRTGRPNSVWKEALNDALLLPERTNVLLEALDMIVAVPSEIISLARWPIAPMASAVPLPQMKT